MKKISTVTLIGFVSMILIASIYAIYQKNEKEKLHSKLEINWQYSAELGMAYYDLKEAYKLKGTPTGDSLYATSNTHLQTALKLLK